MNPKSADLVVTKTVATVDSSVDDGTDPVGSFSLILSDESEDRDGEIIDFGAFEPLPDHLSADTDHGMSVDTTVGSGSPFYDAATRSLRIDGTFASTTKGQDTRTLVREGHIRTASVAFIRRDASKSAADGKKHVRKAELLNFAFTPVPSNKNAKVLSAKSAAAALALKEGKRNSSSDKSQLIDAHNAIADVLDLECGTAQGDTAPSADDEKVVAGHRFVGQSPPVFTGKSETALKSIVGSVEALQDRVLDAVEDAYTAGIGWGYLFLRGVIPNEAGDGGTVVFQGYGVPDIDSDETYQQTYTDDGSVVTLVGQASICDIHEVIGPDADADRETGTTLPPPEDSAANKSAAVSKAADDDLSVRARSLAFMAEAASH